MTDTNGQLTANEEQILKERMEMLMTNEEVLTNLLVSRMEWANSALNPQRNINKECGYPDLIGVETYRSLYDRDAISARVVEVMPKESWQVTPSLYETEDASDETEFETAWKELHQQLKGKSWYQDEEGSPVWGYLLRADILSGIGRYGCLLLGLDDGKSLREPVEGFEDVDSQTFNPGTESQYGSNPLYPYTQGYDEFTTQLIESQDQRLAAEPVKAQKSDKKKSGKRSLLYLKVFDETLAQITMYERDPRNPRFGLPVMYLVTFNDPKFGGQTGLGLAVATQHVHWSRIIHVAEGLGSSDVFAYPRMQQPYNRIFDLIKVYSSSGEGFWQQAFAILSMETHPQLGGDVKIDHRGIDQQMTNLRTRLKRHLITAGMTTKTLAPVVSDPTAYKDAFIEAICIYLGCPVRVFKGSERGELASSQDDSSWNDRLRHRQNFYLTPRVIVPFVDRLIQIGVLPEPEGYSVVWPDLDSLSEKDKAMISQTRTAAMQSYVGGNVEAVMDPMNFLTKIMGFDQEEANEIVEAQQSHLEEKQEEQQDFANQGLDEDGMPQQEESVQPVKVKEGESLVHPETGEQIGNQVFDPVTNRWVTIQGVHVDISGSGKILTGPKGLTGKNVGDLPGRKPEASASAGKSTPVAEKKPESSTISGKSATASEKKIEPVKQPEKKPDAKPQQTPAEWAKSLDPALKRSVQAYSGDDYMRIRACQNHGQRCSEETKTHIENIAKALAKAPKFVGETHRGLAFNSPKELATFVAQVKKNGMTDKGFLSTSADKSVAEEFASKNGLGMKTEHGVIIRMSVKNGVDVSPASKYPKEKEILMPHPSKFKFKGITKVGGKTYLDLEEA